MKILYFYEDAGKIGKIGRHRPTTGKQESDVYVCGKQQCDHAFLQQWKMCRRCCIMKTDTENHAGCARDRTDAHHRAFRTGQ